MAHDSHSVLKSLSLDRASAATLWCIAGVCPRENTFGEPVVPAVNRKAPFVPPLAAFPMNAG